MSESHDQPPTPEEPVVVPTRRRRGEEEAPASRKGIFIVVALVMAATAIVGIVFTSAPLTYAKQVDQLIKEKNAFAGRTVRAQGVLVHNSIQKTVQPTCEYRFRMASGGQEMPVSFKQCSVPDSFRDVPNVDTEVTVEGMVLSDNTFEASTVLAKCASKYTPEEMKARAAAGKQAPHIIDPM